MIRRIARARIIVWSIAPRVDGQEFKPLANGAGIRELIKVDSLDAARIFFAMRNAVLILAASAALWSATSAADSTDARCDIYARGEDQTDKMIPCRFSQRQGYVTIARSDGVTHELAPVGDLPGNFRDQHERLVYRQSDLGDQGLIFRFPDESVYVYWNTEALHPVEANNPTAPFSTADYDATTLLRCRASGDAEFASCPAGILRMDGGQASIVIRNLHGEQFTINFLTDVVNATNREVEATLAGDTWTVTVNGSEVYEVPLAAIEGG